jgi:pimeloyl-ACP methyl ester carboxylesterase
VASKRRIGTAIVLAAALAATCSPAGGAREALAPCASIDGVRCGYVSVPLDYSGASPGHVRLFVTQRPAAGSSRGTILLVAGGPGESATRLFDLTSQLWRTLFPGYTVAAYDDRGTGGSGALACPHAKSAAHCGTALGPARAFYGTRENVEDMEAVRQALGVERIGVFGLSYGTKQALAYAFAHPEHVDRLLLDSVVPLRGPDPLGLDSLGAIPAALRSICRDGGCTGDPVRDFVRLANVLAAEPLVARVPVYRHGWRPAKRRVEIDGHGLLGLATASDLNAGVAVALPAAVREALDGRPALLEHLAALIAEQSSSDVNDAVLYATTCNDGPFPWQGKTTAEVRRAVLAVAVAALSPGSLRGFGSWAAKGPAADCVGWPTAEPFVPAGGRLPDVPVLVLAGDRDVRTPASAGRAAAAAFPRGRFLVAPGVGHTVIGSSACVQSAVRGWILGRVPAVRCPRQPLPLRPLGPAPREPGLAAVLWTLREAEASWLVSYPAGWVAGLVKGLASGESFDTLRYSAYTDIDHVAISGRVTFRVTPLGALVPRSETGIVSVGGAQAGFLQIGSGRISGTLGGRHVSARL